MGLKYQPSSAAAHAYFHSDAGTAKDEIGFHMDFFFFFSCGGFARERAECNRSWKRTPSHPVRGCSVEIGKRVLREEISLRCVACEPGSHVILIKFSSLFVCKRAGCFGVFSSTNTPPPLKLK